MTHIRKALAGAAVLLPLAFAAPAWADKCQYNATPPTIGDGQQAQTQCDANGNALVATPSAGLPISAPAYTGNGSLALTTASALINTMTVKSTGAALPGTLSNLTVIDNGVTDLAVCMPGGTCTCSANAVATTNGLTVKAGGGSYTFRYSVASSTPTIVACSGTPTAEFQW